MSLRARLSLQSLQKLKLKILILSFKLLHKTLGLRIGEIESRAIGHSSIPIEVYLSEIETGVIKKGNDIWFLNKSIANHVLIGKWKRYFKLGPRSILEPIFTDCVDNRRNLHLIVREYRHWKLDDPWQGFDIHKALSRTQVHISFTPEEIKSCEQQMEEMGIKKNFVCAAIRDSAYRGDAPSHRDSDIKDYLACFELLTQEGFQVIRLGAKVRNKLKTNGNTDILDYASSKFRNELLDLYLISKCQFMLSTGLGIDAVGRSFRKPICTVNYAEIAAWKYFSDGEIPLSLLKMYWSSQLRRYLTLEEAFQRGVFSFSGASQYNEEGLIWVANSPDELANATKEMCLMMKSELVLTQEDEELQRRFKSAYDRTYHGPFPSIVSPYFLRKNRDLLFA